MNILIKNGRILDPKNNRDEIGDIFIRDGIIADYDGTSQYETVDADGLWVVPGLIDLHTHLREPGFLHKETIRTGTEAAAAGGFTSVCCMPNTNPVVDNEILVEYVRLISSREAKVNVFPIGAVTKGQNGTELANIAGMAKAGACALSEDGKSVANAAVLKSAMKYASMFDLPVFSHCEDASLAGTGQMNAGTAAELLGLAGISNDSEDVIIARDIILAKAAGIRLHICHISTAGGVFAVETAQKLGLPVTAEVTPHHFTL
ncbi:MAG: dihydroorotase, partial [Clostridiales bacterium]|nr:dihydroorotase [Clostridiales bacterium]